MSYDGKTYNIVAFYINGVEAYREVYPPAENEPHQYRWLGPNGTKWGLDSDRDGRIDEWVVLSPEDSARNCSRRYSPRSEARTKALAVTKANLDQLGLPAAEQQKLLARRRRAEEGDRRRRALKLTPDAKWGSVQLGAAGHAGRRHGRATTSSCTRPAPCSSSMARTARTTRRSRPANSSRSAGRGSSWMAPAAPANGSARTDDPREPPRSRRQS